MSAKDGNVVAVGARAEFEEVGAGVTTVDSGIWGGNLCDGGGVGTATVISNPRWHAEIYLEE